jgi:acetoin utilization deacetylase AcuC-like enzyme
MAGYCYINNAAVAANELSKYGKVAILDIDYHHGNGTQKIFYERSDVLYVSIHAAPEDAFPYSSGFKNEFGRGDGLGTNVNFPLPPETTAQKYLESLGKAFEIINKFSPDYVVVSLGFDTYENDPIGGLGIDEESFRTIGAQIKSNLAYPTLLVQEGGYAVDRLGALSEQFLNGFIGTE